MPPQYLLVQLDDDQGTYSFTRQSAWPDHLAAYIAIPKQTRKSSHASPVMQVYERQSSELTKQT